MHTPEQIEATLDALVRAAAAGTTQDEFILKDAAVKTWTGKHICESPFGGNTGFLPPSIPNATEVDHDPTP